VPIIGYEDIVSFDIAMYYWWGLTVEVVKTISDTDDLQPAI